MALDFEGLGAHLLRSARSILPEWLPGGRIIGHEYTCADSSGGKGRSFKVNVSTGKWKDFSMDGVEGGDLISLYALLNNTRNGDAARELSRRYNYTIETTAVTKHVEAPKTGPPPPGTHPPSFAHTD